jgi:hypothetical protein
MAFVTTADGESGCVENVVSNIQCARTKSWYDNTRASNAMEYMEYNSLEGVLNWDFDSDYYAVLSEPVQTTDDAFQWVQPTSVAKDQPVPLAIIPSSAPFQFTSLTCPPGWSITCPPDAELAGYCQSGNTGTSCEVCPSGQYNTGAGAPCMLCRV